MARTGTLEKEKGLYKNHTLWWVRVYNPATGRLTPRSTGTPHLAVANAITVMARELRANPTSGWPWLTRIADNELTLLELYTSRASMTLGTLRDTLDRSAKEAQDVDIEPLVQHWFERLPETNAKSTTTHTTYLAYVRALIPSGTRFPVSQFTEDYLRTVLRSVPNKRTPGAPLTESSRRRLFSAWSLFFDYASGVVDFPTNPFRHVKRWRPKNNPPRNTVWGYDTTRRVIEWFNEDPEAQAILALIFGAGCELSALRGMQGSSVSHVPFDHTVQAPGTKNEYRTRRVIVDAWAWPFVERYAKSVPARSVLFPALAPNEKRFRERFYLAQVALNLIDQPARSVHEDSHGRKSGKWLWGTVQPHTLHDGRHTYAVTRMLGSDGEPVRSPRFVSEQLGHTDEQMVLRIYGRHKIEQRLLHQEEQRAREKATRRRKSR